MKRSIFSYLALGVFFWCACDWSVDWWFNTAHHCGFSGPFLLTLLRSAGFDNAWETGLRQGDCPDVELLDNRPDESLFCEAIK